MYYRQDRWLDREIYLDSLGRKPLGDFIESLHPLALEAVAQDFGPDWRDEIKALARAIEYDAIFQAEDEALDAFQQELF